MEKHIKIEKQVREYYHLKADDLIDMEETSFENNMEEELNITVE